MLNQELKVLREWYCLGNTSFPGKVQEKVNHVKNHESLQIDYRIISKYVAQNHKQF